MQFASVELKSASRISSQAWLQSLRASSKIGSGDAMKLREIPVPQPTSSPQVVKM